MSTSNLFRLSGWAGILTGLFIIADTLFIELFLPENALTNSVGNLAPILGLFALTGMFLWQRPASGKLGDVGYIVNFLGLALLAGVMFSTNYVFPYLSKSALQAVMAGPTRFVFLAAALIFLAGVSLFSLATLKAAVFPRLATTLYLVGFIPYSLSPFFPDVVVRIAQTTAALGILWLGYALQQTRPVESKHTGVARVFN